MNEEAVSTAENSVIHGSGSDITTNIIRGPLIEFTHDACAYYGIPMTTDVVSGQLWDRHSRRWTQEYTQLPVTPHGRLLLVPKSIVRRNQTFDPGEYFNEFVLPQMQDDELRSESGLVEVLKNGRRRVTKKSLKEHYGQGKHISLDTTLRHPVILERYRAAKSVRREPPTHEEIAELTDSEQPDWDALLSAVTSVPAGIDHATEYHYAVEALLTAVFYPALDQPKREFNIHQGRKRIDISPNPPIGLAG